MSEGYFIGGLAAGVGQGILNNMLSRDNARWSVYQQNRMMEKQNAMNNANIANAPLKQIEGLRMAGFNPAMVNGAGGAAGATVSQGNADMPQTIPFDLGYAQLALVDAQKDNIEAQTEKTKAETELVPTEIEKNQAQTLLYGSQRDLSEEEKNKVIEEAKSIANTNKTYTDANEQLKVLGPSVASDMMKSDWYDKLPDHMKAYVESMASGTTEMSVGALDAFDRLLRVQGGISEKAADSMIKTVTIEVMKKQLQSDEVLAAQANLPEAEYRLKDNQAIKVKEEVTKIQKEVHKIISDIGRNSVLNQKDEVSMDQIEAQIKKIKAEIESIYANDKGILFKNGNYKQLSAVTFLDNLSAIIHTVGLLSGGAMIQGFSVLKKFLQTLKKDKTLDDAGKMLDELNKKNPEGPGRSTSPMNQPPTMHNLPGSTPGTIRDNTLGRKSNGIQSFRFT